MARLAFVVVAVLTPAVALGEVPRPLDLSGARLFAREPSETLLAAMVTGWSQNRKDTTLLREARVNAWLEGFTRLTLE